MPDTLYHVRSALTGARVIIDLTDSDVAVSECDRLNEEARTGIRAAYGEGDDHVPAQRLVSSDSGLADSIAGGLHPELVGRILHDGQPMVYEIEVEHRLTPEELVELAERTARLHAGDPEARA